MSRVLVTGGAGFIGSHIVDRLIFDGHDVTVLDNLHTGKRENLDPRAELIVCDITDHHTIAEHFDGMQAVFHCAGVSRIQPSFEDPLLSHATIVTGTLNVLWAAKNAGVKKFIHSASSSVYGRNESIALVETMDVRPGSPYALHKYMAELHCEQFAKLYGFATVRLRYFNVYGPRLIMNGTYAAAIGIFLTQRRDKQPLTIVGDGEQRRDFTHIDDVVEANMLAWNSDVAPGELFNIGAGHNYSVNEVAALIGGETTHIPARPGEYRSTLANNAKARHILGWCPRRHLPEAIAELKKLQCLNA